MVGVAGRFLRILLVFTFNCFLRLVLFLQKKKLYICICLLFFYIKFKKMSHFFYSKKCLLLHLSQCIFSKVFLFFRKLSTFSSLRFFSAFCSFDIKMSFRLCFFVSETFFAALYDNHLKSWNSFALSNIVNWLALANKSIN